MLVHIRKVVLSVFVGLSFAPAFGGFTTGAQCKKTMEPIVNFIFPRNSQKNMHALNEINFNALNTPIVEFASLDLNGEAPLVLRQMRLLASNAISRCSQTCQNIPLAGSYDRKSINCSDFKNTTALDLFWYVKSIDDNSKVDLADEQTGGNKNPECLFEPIPMHCKGHPILPEVAQVNVLPLPPPAAQPQFEGEEQNQPSVSEEEYESKSLDEIYEEEAYRMRRKQRQEYQSEPTGI